MKRLKFLASIIITLITANLGFSQSVTVNFSAAVTNGLGGPFGSDLPVDSLVQLGTWESGLFTLIDSPGASVAIGDGTNGSAGSFSAALENIDSTTLGIAGKQIALKWFNSTSQASNDFGIAYLPGSVDSNWFIPSTPSEGVTTATIDIGDLNDSSDVLLPSAEIIRGSFGGSSETFNGAKLYMTAIPEPSSYATIAGLLGLAYAVSRRRRRSSSLTRS